MHIQVGVILGSRSEWNTMQHTAELLAHLGIAYEARILTANRNPRQLHDYACKAMDRGLEVIIAGSGGAHHLPGILASKTKIPVLGVPVKTNASKSKPASNKNSSTHSGNPEGMLTTGYASAVNAALLAASMLGNKCPKIREKLIDYRRKEKSENDSYEKYKCSFHHSSTDHPRVTKEPASCHLPQIIPDSKGIKPLIRHNNIRR